MKLIKKIKENEIYCRVLNAIIYGTGCAIISKGLLMIFNIVIARILSEEQYGTYSLINNTVQTFTIFASAGLGSALSRYVALYRERDKNMTGIIIKTLLYFNVFVSAIVSLIMFFCANIISNLISGEIDISAFLRITAATIFFTSIALVLQNVLQGFERYNKIALYQLISYIVMLVVGISMTFYIKTTGAIIALLILNMLMVILFGYSVKEILKNNAIKLVFQMNEIVKHAIISVALPALLSSIFVVPIIWITNSNFIKIHGYEEFAAFSICLQWFTILNYIPQQLGQIKPIYTQLYANNNIKEFNKISLRMITFSFLFSLFISLILCIGSSLLLGMYGEFYSNYKLPFIFMLLAAILFSIQSQFGSIFYAIGKIWLSFLLNVVWAIVFIICFLLFRNQGTIGYTIAYLISYFIYSIVSFICYMVVVKKRERKCYNG